MKLNKKYCNLIDSDSGYDNQLLADCCENIADEFAIGFKLWSFKNIGSLLFVNSSDPIEIEKELLEMYKQEKGL